MLIQTMRKPFLLVIFCCTPFFCPAQQAPTPSQLIEQANAASDLSRLGPYRLKAIIAVGESRHGATGTLTLDHDQQNTRQELEFTDYHEVSLTRGDIGYFQNSPAIRLYVAERVRDFDELWWVGIPPESEVGTVSSAKVHGVKALCFTARPDKFSKIRYCFDAATHLLVSRSEHGSEDLEILYQNYQELDGVHFPATIRFAEEDKAAMEVRNIAAVKMAHDPGSFTPPAGSRGFNTCQHLMEPRLMKRVDPQYPGIPQLRNMAGIVYLLVNVGEDGKVRKVTPLRGTPGFVEVAADAMKQWEYKPALCPSGPVENTRIMMFRFHPAPSRASSQSGSSAASERQSQTRTGTTGR
jgi:TonB-like protein